MQIRNNDDLEVNHHGRTIEVGDAERDDKGKIHFNFLKHSLSLPRLGKPLFEMCCFHPLIKEIRRGITEGILELDALDLFAQGQS